MKSLFLAWMFYLSVIFQLNRYLKGMSLLSRILCFWHEMAMLADSHQLTLKIQVESMVMENGFAPENHAIVFTNSGYGLLKKQNVDMQPDPIHFIQGSVGFIWFILRLCCLGY